MIYTGNRFLLFIIFVSLFACKEAARPEAKEPINLHPVPTSQADAKNPYASIDISPMDMSYYPADYPQLKMAGIITTPPIMRVIYSRPHLQGRRLFIDIIKHNEPWRLGANEATELDVFTAVKIGNKQIAPGRYILYALPHEKGWTIVINTNIDSWGLKPDAHKDIVRVDIPVTTGNTPLEYFTMVFEKAPFGANLLIGWDDVLAKLPVIF